MSKIFVSRGAVVSTADSTKAYLNEIKKPGLLSRDEERELAIQARAGDQAAINRLVTCNLRFVTQVARGYQGMGIPMEDLIGFGNLGLFEAVSKFDPDKGVKFISFAVWYVRAEIQKALNDFSRVVRIPSHKTKSEEYSEQSTDIRIGEDENAESYADRYLAAESVPGSRELEDLRYELDRALQQIKPKQREAVCRFYGIGYEYPQVMDQIAEEMNITGERARQLVRQAECSLRELSGIELLQTYL
jgi:RNA polymerase primary sigma factor